jgi:hypothetical protein
VPPPPCNEVRFACRAQGGARVSRVSQLSDRPDGLDALASRGDYVLDNGVVRVVIDDVSPALARGASSAARIAHNRDTHTHHLAPSGGTIIDIAPSGGVDHLNQIYPITGIVPRDALHYTSLEAIQDGETAVVIARGFLDVSTGGDERVRVVTRYELRPCDPGVRVRTELYNGGRTAWSSMLADAWFWGDRSQTVFIQGRGGGFNHPDLDLLDIDGSLASFAYLAASSHSAPDTSYAMVACDRPLLLGVNSATISAAGVGPSYVAPGDGLVFERFIAAARGPGVANSVNHAMHVREQLFGEHNVTVTGHVSAPDTVFGDERLGSVLLYEPGPNGTDDVRQVTVWSEAVPDSTGTFSARLPAGRPFKAQWWRMGRPLGTPVSFTTPTTADATLELPEQTLTALGKLVVSVTIRGPMAPVPESQAAEVVLIPKDAAQVEALRGSIYGYFNSEACSPYLGSTHGGSPGCNRVLLANSSPTQFVVPDGTYYVYAHGGPERTIARQEVTVTEGTTQTVSLQLQRIEVFPDDSMTADFHVHSGRSFDTQFPERDRILSVLAMDMNLIAATDHDVVTDYQQTVAALQASRYVEIQPGVEMTQLVPAQSPPGSTLPRTIGHFNAWPMPVDILAPRNGAPWDELTQAGEIIDLLRPYVDADPRRGQGFARGIVQLNHPFSGSKLGRDEGYFRFLRWNPSVPLPQTADGTAPGLLTVRPSGPSGNRNVDFDTIETLCGMNLLDNLSHRAGWFGLLNAGHLRAATADSDSHSLEVEPFGYPRNVILGIDRFRYVPNEFNDLVRGGSIVGTTGPFISAVLASNGGVGPSIYPVTPAADARFDVTVRAAPWIPVNELRVIVNGRVVKTIGAAMFSTPPDPFGTMGIERFRGSFTLAELGITGARDVWVLFEAGQALPTVADTDNDGLPDHADFNGDGNATELVPTRPAESDPRFHAHALIPGYWSFAYTNPWILNMNGGNWEAPIQ